MKRSIFFCCSCGFTLVELMIVVAITALVSTAAFGLYSAQERTYLRQQQLIEMNQDIRAFLYFLEKDIRIAGYDPTRHATDAGIRTLDSGITIAEPARIELIADLGMRRDNPACNHNEGCDSMPDEEINQIPCDGCVAERMRYLLVNGAVSKIFNDKRSTDNLNPQVIIENVDHLEFLYHLADGTAETAYPQEYDRSRILSIDVSMLVHSRTSIKGYKNRSSYQPASGTVTWGPYNDNLQRILVVTNIKCRNMELQDEKN
jgi:prepilin-type N-terminal cleavage/methylation domain-containing protein